MTDRIDWIISEHEGNIDSTKDLYPLYDSYCSEFGQVSEETFKRYCRSAKDLLDTEDDIKVEAEQIKQETKLKGKKQTDSSLELALTSYDIKDVDGVIAWANVDTTKWELHSQNIRVSSNLNNPWYIIDCKFRLKDQRKVSPEEYAERFISQISSYTPPKPSVKHPEFTEKQQDMLAEICIMDFHFGQASWKEETRDQDVDIKSASKLLSETIDYFIEKTRGKVSGYILPLGNDFFNVDNEANTTTGGTHQDEDANFKKTHLTAEAILIEQIDKLSMIAPVEVVCISGNHDKQRLWYLGEYLRAWYRNSGVVKIDNTPPQRKYVNWGKNLIGYTHGNNEVRGSLPVLMFEEAGVDFSKIEFKEWHTGHLHGYAEKNTRVAKESFGIREIVLPSLVPLDAWHSGKGYRHLCEAVCFMWDKNKGKTTTHYYHP